MATVENGEEEWSAVRVRDTFLNYFKKNGHTFGQFPLPRLKARFDIESQQCYSSFVIGRSALGPYFTIYKCWDESVQVHFLGHG